MLFMIKSVHSLIFVVVSAAILYVWYALVADLHGLLLAFAVGIILLETGVYVFSGLHCPLTHLAQKYGDVRGDDYIADIFLPAWFVPRVPQVCGTLAVSGLLALIVRALLG